MSSVALATAVMASTALMSNSAIAITVNNSSFETLAVGYPNFGPGSCAPGCTYSVGLGIPGWTITSGDVGQFQPGNPLNTNYFNTLPWGPTVAYSNGGSIAQIVGTAQVGVTYTLQVDVGARNDGYHAVPIETLVVGSNTAFATGAYPSDGNWSNWTATYTAQAGDAGAPITINLISTGPQGDWDNVRLSATPLPAALPLFAGGLGVIGLVARRRKRKNAAARVAA